MQKKLTFFYLIPLWIIFLINCFFSLLKTTYFDLYMVIELPKYKKDHPLILLATLVMFLAAMLLFYRYFEKHFIKMKNLTVAVCIYAAVISSFFVLLFKCGVVCDSGLVNNIVIQVMEGNYEAFERGAYLHHYPFQLGLVAMLEILYRLFGVENFLVFQFINVAAIVSIIYLLQRITRELFVEERAAEWEAILSFGMLPLYLFATFVYGDLIGFAFGIGAVYCGVRYIRSNCWKYLFIAGILFAFAVVAKSNIYVLMVAFAIAMLLKCFHEKKWSILLWLAGIFILSQAGVQTVNIVYASRAGMEEMWKGTPKAAWIAMGLQDANEEENGCGWYNGYNWEVYEQNGFDNEVTTQVCISNIKDSLDGFIHNPFHGVYFFYKKFVSQWNAPTFQSMITNEWYSRHTENRSSLADFFIYYQGRDILSALMNLYHFLIFVCSSVGCLYIIRNWSLERAYFVLNIFGGLLFHMIWEAQSRYILGYYVMMLPIAAVGCNWILKKLSEGISRKRINNKNKGVV